MIRGRDPKPAEFVFLNTEYWCTQGLRNTAEYMYIPVTEVGKTFARSYPQDSRSNPAGGS